MAKRNGSEGSALDPAPLSDFETETAAIDPAPSAAPVEPVFAATASIIAAALPGVPTPIVSPSEIS